MPLNKAESGKTRIGWIGTGVMGRWMCQHAIGKGYKATIFNRNKDKLFGFMSQEWNRNIIPNTLRQITVPTAAQRTGNFAGTVNGAGVPQIIYHHYHLNHHWGDNDAKGPDGTTRDWSSTSRRRASAC